MSIARVDRKRKGPGWKVWYRDIDGRGRSQTFDRKTDAKAFEASVRLKKRHGSLSDLDAAREPLRVLVEDWWDRYAVPSHAPKTQKTNRWLLDRYVLPGLGNVPLGLIRPTTVEDFDLALQHDRVGTEVRRKALALLQTILNRAVIRARFRRTRWRSSRSRHRSAVAESVWCCRRLSRQCARRCSRTDAIGTRYC